MYSEDKESLDDLVHNIDINSPTSSTYKIRHLFRFLIKENEELRKRVASLEAKMVSLNDEEQ